MLKKLLGLYTLFVLRHLGSFHTVAINQVEMTKQLNKHKLWILLLNNKLMQSLQEIHTVTGFVKVVLAGSKSS